MDRGIYSAASGGLSSVRLMEVIGANLANANTVGYKAERLVNRQQSFEDTLAGALSNSSTRAAADHQRTPGVTDIGTITDFTAGPVDRTGNPLHVALADSHQFFVVKTPTGETLSRAGNFTMDQTGFLVATDGMQVLGDGGPIALQPGARINQDGSVVAGTQSLGKLRVVQVDDFKQLQRINGTRFRLSGGAQAAPVDAKVIPESVELPNITVVQSMTDMINANRAFESYTKSARTINDLDETAMRTARSAG